MGGLAIINAAAVSALAVTAFTGELDIRVAGVIVLMYLFALIGFIDDYEKAIKKNNAGISPKQKIIMQFGFSTGISFPFMTSVPLSVSALKNVIVLDS